MADPDKLDPKRAAGVIARSPHGRILMCHRTDGEGWAFPGGGIKGNENTDTCAFREFFEETGYRLGSVGKFLMRRIKDGVDFTTYIADVEDEFTPKLNHEHDAYAWLSPQMAMAEHNGALGISSRASIATADSARADQFGMGHWEESKHPRGQPENAGQFAEGHGVVPPAQAKEAPEPFEEPHEGPTPSGKALKEAGKPRTPEEQKAAIGTVKAKAQKLKGEQSEMLDKQQQHEVELAVVKKTGKAGQPKKPSALGDAPEKPNEEAISDEAIEEMSAIPLFEKSKTIDYTVSRKNKKTGKVEDIEESAECAIWEDGSSYHPGEVGNDKVANELVKGGQKMWKAYGIASGRVDSTNATPQINEVLAKSLALQVKRAIDAAKEEGGEKHAADWYRAQMNEALDVAAMVHPEIRKDKHALTAFSAAMAICSQGETVFENARLADIAFNSWKKNGGRFKLTKEDLKANKGKQMLENFAKYDKMLDAAVKEAGGDENVGKEALRALLGSQMKVRDYMKATGLKKPTGFGMDGDVYGSAMFGPKIGNGFFQNLIGNFNPVTQDLWFMRTFGRMCGTLRDVVKTQEGVTEAFDKYKANLIQGLKTDTHDIKGVSEEEVNGWSQEELEAKSLETFSEAQADYKKNGKEYRAGKMERPTLYAAALRTRQIIKGVMEMPGNTKDRLWRGEVVAQARKMLAADGVELSNADLQATIWYPEKTLWKRMGSRGPRGGNADYSDAMQLLVLNQNKGNPDKARADIEKMIKRKIKPDLEEMAKTKDEDEEDEDENEMMEEEDGGEEE